MASISDAVRTLKGSLRESLGPREIIAACEAAGHRWRVRKLDPVRTIWLFVLQILHGNTACVHVARLLPGLSVSDAAYCQARSRIPLQVFVRLFERLADALQRGNRPLSFHGRRVLHVDGTSCSMPDVADLDDRFGHPTNQAKGCSFPRMHVMALIEAGTGLLIGLVSNPLRTHDAKAVAGVHGHLRAGDILVGDRAFSGFAHIAVLLRLGVDAVFRQHQRSRSNFRGGRILGIGDRIVTIHKRWHVPTWMSKAAYEELPETLQVRVIRYRITAPGYRTHEVRLVTTLLDASRYPVEELARLYRDRWEIEVNFRHIKQTLEMDMLKCRTVEGVLKEMYVFGMTWNLVRAKMIEAAERQGVTPDRISFIDVMRWLASARPGDPMPRFKVNPRRSGRHRPRVVKRRPKHYRRKGRWDVELILASAGGYAQS